MEKMQLIALFISFILPIPLSALLLMATSRIFKLEDKSYKTAIKVLAGSSVIGFVFSYLLGGVGSSMIATISSTAMAFVVSIVVLLLVFLLPTILLIRRFYKLEWKKVFSVSLVWLIFHMLLMFIVISPIWAIVSFTITASSGVPMM